MIVLRFKNGQVVELTQDTELAIDGQPVKVTDIGRIELEDMRLGGGDTHFQGTVFRNLAQTDPVTGIHVVTPMPLEVAKEVGGFLVTGGGVQVASEVPKPL